MTDTIAIGNIDEGGYLGGFDRRGFTPERCLLELVANSLDAITAAGRSADGWIEFRTDSSRTRMMDNGIGMDHKSVKNMFAMHRENHATDTSRGVSGIGAKPALSILSEKKHVKILTKKKGEHGWCIDVPWDKIHRDGRYTDMIHVRKMTGEELVDFARESGTTIEFPNSDLLTRTINANLNKETPPLDRIPVVFGRDVPTISYVHFESDKPVLFPKYNYFAVPNEAFYTGIYTPTIEQYYNPSSKKTRWLLNDGCTQTECVKKGRGISLEPETPTEGLHGWVHKGSYTVRVGLRRDPAIFDEKAPCLPTASDKMDEHTKDVVGEEYREFNSCNKLVRNSQTIGIFPYQDRGDTSRANGRAFVTQRLVQCEASFNPVSSHDNHMDREMQIQENKNQHHAEALPKEFTRLVRAARFKKADIIWDYFEKCVAAAVVKSATVEGSVAAVEESVAVVESATVEESAVAVVEPAATVEKEEDEESETVVEAVVEAVESETVAESAAAVEEEEDEDEEETVAESAAIEDEESATVDARTVSGAELMLLMIKLRDNLDPSFNYNKPDFILLRDTLHNCLLFK